MNPDAVTIYAQLLNPPSARDYFLNVDRHEIRPIYLDPYYLRKLEFTYASRETGGSAHSVDWKDEMDTRITRGVITRITQNLITGEIVPTGDLLVVCPAANYATHEFWLYQALSSGLQDQQVQLIAGDIATFITPAPGEVAEAFEQDPNLTYTHFDGRNLVPVLETRKADLIFERYGSIWYTCLLVIQNVIGIEYFWKHMEHIHDTLSPKGSLILDNVSMNATIKQPSTIEMIDYMFAAVAYFDKVPISKLMAQLLELFRIVGVGNQEDFTAVTVFNKK